MEIINIITGNWETIISIIVTPIIAWIVGRKRLKVQLDKESAETKIVETEGISSNLKLYQELINDLELRFKSRINDLEKDLEKMKVLNEELRKAISNQEKYIKKLQLKLSNYEELEG